MRDEFTSIPIIAKEIGVSAEMLWKEAAADRIPFIRYKRRILIPRGEFEKFLRELPTVSATHALRNIKKLDL